MPGGIHPSLLVEGSWPVANYVNPQKHGWGLAILVIILTALTIFVVSLRIWVRIRLQRNGGLDDIFIVATMVGDLCLS
jgi:hypothetical protein